MQSYTWRFRLRSGANRVVNWVYPPDQGTCLLCQRPLHAPSPTATPPRSPRAGAARAGEGGAAVAAQAAPEVPAGICLFCLQDAALATGTARPRTVRVAGRQVPVYPAMPYEGLARTAIRKWKYDGVETLTAWFGAKVARACAKAGEVHQAQGIVPVPTSYDRFRKRGYDHVGLLGADVARRLHLPVDACLKRQNTGGEGFTQSQTAKSVAARRQSLVGAYTLRQGADVRGRRLLLVDDVVTTGATVEACAKVLFAAGAASVVCLAISAVESPGSRP